MSFKTRRSQSSRRLIPLNYITLITLLLSSETQEGEYRLVLFLFWHGFCEKKKRKREEKRKRRRKARGQGAALLPTLSSWQEHSNSALSGRVRQTLSSIIGPIQLALVLEVTPSPPIETHR